MKSKKVHELHLENAVIFTGIRNDTNLFYNAFDLFVLPSLFEGLGIVAIEAEANGCNTFLSTSVPQEAIISQNVEHIPLNINQWVEKSIFLIKTTPQE